MPDTSSDDQEDYGDGEDPEADSEEFSDPSNNTLLHNDNY